MFMSEYVHSLDSKGRLIIPQKFREQLGEEFVLCRGVDHNLNLYTSEGWNTFITKLSEIPELSNPDARNIARFFIAGATTCETDKQGRILVPQGLREYAGMSKDVVLAGVGNRIELWDKAAWDQNNTFDIHALTANMKEFKI